MSTVILFAIVLFNGQVQTTWAPFLTMEQCEKAKAAVIKQALELGITDGSFVCTPHTLGKLT